MKLADGQFDPQELLGDAGLQLEAYEFSRDLGLFTRECWHIIEPHTQLEWGKVNDAICQHLQALKENKIKNLLIEIPPGNLKTIQVSVIFNAWCWTSEPWLRFLWGSNEEGEAEKSSNNCRTIIDSEWYRSRWPNVALSESQNTKNFYTNSSRGHRQAITPQSKTTGKKGDIIGIDDADDATLVHDDAVRKRVHKWWDQAFYNRVNDHKKARRVVIGQRLHFDDLIGHIRDTTKGKGWTCLTLPEEFDPARKCITSVGFEDWRTEAGELLRPERFGPEEILEARKRLGPAGYSAQHQQDPLQDEGALFQVDDLTRATIDHDQLPMSMSMYRFWDLAGSEPKPGRDPDYTCSVLMGRHGDDYYVLDVTRWRKGPGDTKTLMRMIAERDGIDIPVRIEEEAGASGKFLAADLISHLAGFAVDTKRSTGSKFSRARAVASQLQLGFLKIVRNDTWLNSFLMELLEFRQGCAHDDQVDALSGAFQMVSEKPAWVITETSSIQSMFAQMPGGNPHRNEIPLSQRIASFQF